jgi:UDP-glucose:(heptosyl)LPS alpha-1,3-glucosyltransferase
MGNEMQDQSVVIIRSSYSNYGGIEKIALDVIKALLENKVYVKLLTWEPDAWPIVHPKLQIVPIGMKKGPRFLQAVLFNRGVVGFVKRHRPECIFSFDRVTIFTHLHGGGGTHRTFLRIKNDASSLPSSLFRRLSLFHWYTLHVEKNGLLNQVLKRSNAPHLW